MTLECRVKQKIDESETGYYLVAEIVNILCDEKYLAEDGKPDVEKMEQTGNDFNLNQSPFRQSLYSNGRSCRVWLCEKLCINSFISAKSFISAMNTVIFTTLSIVRPASSKIAFTLSKDWRVCSLISPSTKLLVAGLMGICPEV